MSSRVDLHVHSNFSGRPSEWILREIGANRIDEGSLSTTSHFTSYCSGSYLKFLGQLLLDVLKRE